jgi:ABC-type multidrug transport system fused ATPase/permease subunit
MKAIKRYLYLIIIVILFAALGTALYFLFGRIIDHLTFDPAYRDSIQ